MKLRGQLNLLLLATALVPFIATSLFSYQLNRVAKEESSNHLESMIVAKSISRTLNQNAQMFDGSAKELGRLALKQHENVQLGLYSKDRALQFQSSSEEGDLPPTLRQRPCSAICIVGNQVIRPTFTRSRFFCKTKLQATLSFTLTKAAYARKRRKSTC